MTMPTGYIGGPGAQPMMSAAEPQVVGQQPMLPGLMVVGAPLPSASPVFSEARAANEHSEHMLRNLMIGFDVFERYFQQMQKHADLMEANTSALTQHTQALIDMEKQLNTVRKSGLDVASEEARVKTEASRRSLAHAKEEKTTRDETQRRTSAGHHAPPRAGHHPGGTRTSGEDLDPKGPPPSPEPPSPTHPLEDYRAGGVPRVVSSRMERHYANRIRSLGGDRLNELWGKEDRTPEEDQEYQHLLNRTAHARRGVKIAQGVEQHGVLGALSGEIPMVARAAGVVGIASAAYEGVQRTAQAVSGLHQTEAGYQQGVGGGQGAGMWQDVRSRMFGYRNMFGMGERNARELFQGVTSMGIDDAQGRRSALDFATSEFNKTGMQVAQSLELIRTAASNGVTDFSKFSDAIDSVSKAAREGGISVGQAQQMFTQTYGSVAQTAGGQAGIALSQAITSGMARLGPEVADNVNINGVATNEVTLRRQASQMGMSYSQLLGHMMDPTSGARFSLTVGQRSIDQLADAVAGPGGRARISQMVQQVMAGGADERSAVRQVASTALKQNLLNMDRLMSLAPSYGAQSTDPSALAQWFVQSAIGGLNIGPGNQPSGALQTTLPGSRTALQKASAQSILDMQVHGESFGNVQAHPGLVKQEETIAASMHYNPRDARSNRDLSQYQTLVEQYGKRDPVLEALLAKGVYDSKTRFRVQTKDGPRDVSLGIATHHYLDQLHAGNVEIVAGEHKNEMVSQVTGIVDPNFQGANLATTKSSASQAAPKSEYVKKPKDGGGGTVIIKPSPELQRILSFSPSGGVFIDDGRQSGMPSPPFAPLGDRPTSGSG